MERLWFSSSVLLSLFFLFGKHSVCSGLVQPAHDSSAKARLWKCCLKQQQGDEILVDDMEGTASLLLNSPTAAKFQIVTCSATSCAKARKQLRQDEFATFSAFYTRAQDSAISVQETSCLGQCRFGPCVGVQHEDYEGTVSLESGMTAKEFGDRVFQNIANEDDANRVWSSVVDAVRVMAIEEAEESDESNGEGVPI